MEGRMSPNSPIKLSSMKEACWAKNWLRHQIQKGRFPGLRDEAVTLLSGFDAIQSFVDRHVVEQEDRRRLQKVLSARRSRERIKSLPPHKRHVTTELELEAREMLLAVAKSKGVSTSQLIMEKLEADYMKLQ